jgi:hypothetical protein
MPLVTIFFGHTNELWFKMYSHIPYKPLQDCDYRQKTLQNKGVNNCLNFLHGLF